MKKNVLTLSLVFCFAWLAIPVYAQEKLEEFMNENTPEERAQMQTDYMTETLALTSAQVPTIHEVNLKYARKMQSAYNSGGGKLQKLKGMKRVGEEKDKELKSNLTEAQYALYQTNKEQMKEKIRARAKERRKG